MPKRDDSKGLEGGFFSERRDQDPRKEREQDSEGLVVSKDKGDEGENEAARSGREAGTTRKATTSGREACIARKAARSGRETGTMKGDLGGEWGDLGDTRGLPRELGRGALWSGGPRLFWTEPIASIPKQNRR